MTFLLVIESDDLVYKEIVEGLGSVERRCNSVEEVEDIELAETPDVVVLGTVKENIDSIDALGRVINVFPDAAVLVLSEPVQESIDAYYLNGADCVIERHPLLSVEEAVEEALACQRLSQSIVQPPTSEGKIDNQLPSELHDLGEDLRELART